jgi:uncharacterized membrane protein
LKISRIITLALVVVFYILALVLYNRLPDPMVSHWNAQGVADGYMSRFWGVFLLPFIVTGIAALLLFIPRIDPLKANIAKFRGVYDWFIAVFTGYMLYIYVLTLLWNLNANLELMQFLVPGMAALFFFAGVLMEKARRNYFIGIRTPWTLSNDEVWDRTHKLGGRLFKIGALITLLGIFWPDLAIWFIMVPVLLAALVSIGASYFYYQQVTAAKQPR